MNFSCLEAKTTCNFKSFMLKSSPWSVELYEGGIKSGFFVFSIFFSKPHQNLNNDFSYWSVELYEGVKVQLWSFQWVPFLADHRNSKSLRYSYLELQTYLSG